MIKQKLTRLQEEIFRLACLNSGKKLNQSEIARLLGVSSAAVSKSIPSLEKEGLVKVDRTNKIKLVLIELNRDNPMAIELKRVENLRQIYESGLLAFLEEANPGHTIIVFGSYSRGEDTIKSDLDIAIIGRSVELSMGKFEKQLLRPVHTQYVPSLEKLDKELLSNICNGIVLSGALEL